MTENHLCKYSIWGAYNESDGTTGHELLYQNNSKELIEDLLPIFKKHFSFRVKNNFSFINVYMYTNEEAENPLPF